eukprot:TRINITY_DN90406_c0_g1_i1.p1 TRINITY_DN90406_c0_g1~~TRINITY_DN90406_c0_g1_i1.p1  ORF type:complete len:111 (+),score=1.60 TRINITY_DN90406_c0_g1_i1:3-335(+)
MNPAHLQLIPLRIESHRLTQLTTIMLGANVITAPDDQGIDSSFGYLMAYTDPHRLRACQAQRQSGAPPRGRPAPTVTGYCHPRCCSHPSTCRTHCFRLTPSRGLQACNQA